MQAPIYTPVQYIRASSCGTIAPGPARHSSPPCGRFHTSLLNLPGPRPGILFPSVSVLSQRFVHYTIAFPVSSAGGDARAMRGHRQAFPTPRGGGKSDPKGGLARPPGGTRGVSPRLRYAGDAGAAPGVVARRL